MMNHKYHKEDLSEIYLTKQIKVLESSDKTKENIEGIVFKETKNMFFIKTNDNEIKKIPKKECIFMIDKKIINGEKICYRLAERIKKYF